jgi:hypothetical protein
MSFLTVILVLAMLLWALGFVVSGLVLAEEVLWHRPVGKGASPASRTREVGAMLLLVIGGIQVAIAIATGILVAERESRLVRLQKTVSQLESTVRALENRLEVKPSPSLGPPARGQ